MLLKEAKGKRTPTMLDGSFSPLCVDIVWCVMYTRIRNMMYTYIILYIPRKLFKECHLYQLSPSKKKNPTDVHSSQYNKKRFHVLVAQHKFWIWEQHQINHHQQDGTKWQVRTHWWNLVSWHWRYIVNVYTQICFCRKKSRNMTTAFTTGRDETNCESNQRDRSKEQIVSWGLHRFR